MKKIPLSPTILPNLITMGNGICGFAALVKLSTLRFSETGELVNPENLIAAAWLILLAMIFDAFDGAVARMTHTSSELGIQLDSMCDLISFGVAPGLLVVMVNPAVFVNPFWSRVAWLFGLTYTLATLLRLARFNTETSTEEKDHEAFLGLPSPAAAGMIASLTLLSQFMVEPPQYLFSFSYPQVEYFLLRSLPLLALVLAYLMVSRIPYPHLITLWAKQKKTSEVLSTCLFVGVCVALLPEIALAVLFASFVILAPFWQASLARAKQTNSQKIEH